VFGCGGDRDRGKRPMMGQVAAELSDYPIVTSDNPRNETPSKIIADVLEGMGPDTLTFVDRADAIRHAIASANTRDVVLIAGKGHENYQIIGNQRTHFSDVEVARQCLQQRAPTDSDRQ
jgi:UDP-N-acetylmuramoyl-L-alanyl-D-glutamate--2,6-diaminopimelate ligase